MIYDNIRYDSVWLHHYICWHTCIIHIVTYCDVHCVAIAILLWWHFSASEPCRFGRPRRRSHSNVGHQPSEPRAPQVATHRHVGSSALQCASARPTPGQTASLPDFTVSRVWETSPESLSGKSFRKCWICFGLTYHAQFVSRGNRDNIMHLTFAENVVFPHVATVCCSFPALPYISCLQVSDALWEWAGGPLAMALSGRPRPMPFCAVVFWGFHKQIKLFCGDTDWIWLPMCPHSASFKTLEMFGGFLWRLIPENGNSFARTHGITDSGRNAERRTQNAERRRIRRIGTTGSCSRENRCRELVQQNPTETSPVQYGMIKPCLSWTVWLAFVTAVT